MSKVGSMGAIVLPTPQISKKRSFMVAWRHYYTLPRMLCAKNFCYCFIFVSFGFDKLPEKHKITTIHILQQKKLQQIWYRSYSSNNKFTQLLVTWSHLFHIFHRTISRGVYKTFKNGSTGNKFDP